MKPRIVAVAVLLALAGCVSGGKSPSAVQPSPSITKLARVKVPSVKEALTADQMQPCLYRKHVKPDQGAIASQGLGFWLAAQVENSRDIQFDLSIDDIELASDAEFSRAVRPRSRSAAREQERVLKWLAWALGLSPHGIDVNAFLGGDESTLIAGFYNQETGKIVVRSGERISGQTVITLAHEMAHAATDQAFGIPSLKSDRVIDDKRLALRSLAEGDASLVEMRFISRFVPDKPVTKVLKKKLALEDRFEKERRHGVPQVLIDEFIFPYQWGLSFICTIYKKEGWKAINRMYRRPPQGSAQIMFPDRWLERDNPSEPEPLGRLPKPWKVRTAGTIGAAHLKALFEAPRNLPKEALSKPVARAASWDGGRYTLWVSGDEEIGSVGMALVEHPDYPGVLCDSMRKWYTASFFEAEERVLDDQTISYRSQDQLAVIMCSGRDVLIGIAPNLDLAQTLIRHTE